MVRLSGKSLGVWDGSLIFKLRIANGSGQSIRFRRVAKGECGCLV